MLLLNQLQHVLIGPPVLSNVHPQEVVLRQRLDRWRIRFQPEGWWSGFTERCIVARVRPDGVTVAVPKSACVRVEAPR